MSTEFAPYINWMDLNNAEIEPHDGERKIIDPGEYDFEITGVEQSQSRAGNPTMVTTNKVISDGDTKGREMRNYYSLKGDNVFSKGRFKAIVQATGVQINSDGGVQVQSFIGTRFRGKVVEEEFEGQNRQTGAPEMRTWSKIVSETTIVSAAAIQ